MSNYDRSILSIIDPSLKPVELKLQSVENNSAPENREQTEHGIGNLAPHIEINALTIGLPDIINFRLSLDSFIPMLSLTFKDSRQVYPNLSFPRDGDIVSIFIRSNSTKTYRPLRIDFDIISTTGTQPVYTVNGVMKIPGLYKEVCKSYPEINSFDLLQTLAEELNIGYASNDTTTNDEMTWINPYDSYEKFIKDITATSYKDDNSFFNSYIDFHYYLCNVNVNKQFSFEAGTDESEISFAYNESLVKESSDDFIEKFPLGLSNHPSLQNTSNYISNYVFINNTARTWINNGYKRHVQYFNTEDDSYLNFYIDPLTTEGAENEYVLMKGKPNDDFYKEQVKYKWMGLQTTNAHSNHIYSSIHNKQNLDEINKMGIRVKLETLNLGIYRYQRIPIFIYETEELNVKQLEERDALLNEPEEKGENYSNVTDAKQSRRLNKIVSGYYIVKDISYTFKRNDQSVGMEIILVRREWPIQPIRAKA